MILLVPFPIGETFTGKRAVVNGPYFNLAHNFMLDHMVGGDTS